MDILAIIVALALAFIAYKVLMGLMRVGVIVLIAAILAGMYQQGVFA
ncbi:hypothetical protein [Erythrobacter sp. MTPC3]